MIKMATKLATAVERSENSKLASPDDPVGVSATYAAQQSCPRDCAFYHNGCYAEAGPAGITARRLNHAAQDRKAGHMAVARAEAREIRGLSGTRPLRLHVLGDCRSDEAAQAVSQAVADVGFPVAWTYTHAHRTVARESWGSVSVLASVEKVEDVAIARDRGYPAMLVVDDLPKDGKAFILHGEKIVPCPEQTRGVPCNACRLCWKAPFLLASKTTIAVAAHGSGQKKVKEVLGLVSIEASATR